MSSLLNPVAPTSLNPLPQRTIATGETLRIDQQNNVDVAATVNMPTTYDDNTIVIVQAAGDADADPITINGNGQTIDGEASATLNWNRGVMVFGRDAQIGEWCKLVAPRQLDGSVGLLMKARDVKGAVAAAAGWSFGLLASPADACVARPNSFAWNETHGMKFYNFVAMTCLGVRFATGPAGSGKTFKVTLWNAAGVALATKTVASEGDNVAQTVLFDAAVSLPAGLATGDRYAVSVKCTSANYVVLANMTMSAVAGVGSWPNVNSWPFVMMPGVLFTQFCWVAGDAYPSTDTTAYLSWAEPILEYP